MAHAARGVLGLEHAAAHADEPPDARDRALVGARLNGLRAARRYPAWLRWARSTTRSRRGPAAACSCAPPIGAFLIFACSAATVASAGLLEVDQLIRIVKSESAPIPGIAGALDDVKAGQPQTILVLGSDRRFIDIKEKNPVRSDTLLLVRLDPARGVTASCRSRATSR